MEFSKKEIITTSWFKTKEHLLALILISIIYLSTMMILVQIFTLMSPNFTNNLMEDNISKIFNFPELSLQNILFILASALFITGLNLGFLQICINILKNENVEIKKLFNSFNILFPYVLTTIYYGIAQLIIAAPGMMLLILFIKLGASVFFYYLGILLTALPAVYLSIRLQFYVYLLIDNNMGCLESLQYSFIISRGYVYQLFIIGAILSIIIQISIVPFFLGLIIALPFSKMVTTYTYLKLFQGNQSSTS